MTQSAPLQPSAPPYLDLSTPTSPPAYPHVQRYTTRYGGPKPAAAGAPAPDSSERRSAPTCADVRGLTRALRAIARRYASLSLSRDDLVQEGLLGVIAAWPKWDPAHTSGCSLRTYVLRRAHSHILRACRMRGAGDVRMGVKHAQACVREGKRGYVPTLSLDMPLGEAGGDATLHGVLACAAAEAPLRAAEARLALETLRARTNLTSREALVLELHSEGWLHVEIAPELGVTRERSRQILERACDKLRRVAATPGRRAPHRALAEQ